LLVNLVSETDYGIVLLLAIGKIDFKHS